MHSTFGTHTMRTLQDIKALLSLIGTSFMVSLVVLAISTTSYLTYHFAYSIIHISFYFTTVFHDLWVQLSSILFVFLSFAKYTKYFQKNVYFFKNNCYTIWKL